MKVIEWLERWCETDAYLRRVTPVWARRHLPGADEFVAATVARVVVNALGVRLDQLKADTDLDLDVGCNELWEWQEIQTDLEAILGGYWGTCPRFRGRSLGELVAFVSQNRPHLCMEPPRRAKSLEDWCLSGALDANGTLKW